MAGLRGGSGSGPSARGCLGASPPPVVGLLRLAPRGFAARGREESSRGWRWAPGVAGRLAEAGHGQPGAPDILVVLDAGYDIARLAFLRADLPVEVCGRLRSDRVLCFPAPPRGSGRGRPSRHGEEFKLAEERTWPRPAVTTTTETTRYGTAVASSWNRLHPRLTGRGAWADHDGQLPVIDGTLIRLHVDHLPGDRNPKPVWLWSSHTGADTPTVDLLWQAFLRRFDLEHTFRLFKQVP